MSAKLTWCSAVAEYYKRTNLLALISIQHGNTVHTFPVDLQAMECVIQDLMVNTQYTISLSVEIYGNNGARPRYQVLGMEHFRTSRYRESKFHSEKRCLMSTTLDE